MRDGDSDRKMNLTLPTAPSPMGDFGVLSEDLVCLVLQLVVSLSIGFGYALKTPLWTSLSELQSALMACSSGLVSAWMHLARRCCNVTPLVLQGYRSLKREPFHGS